MRIVIAHEALAGAGGVESYLRATIPALVARGHEVAFLHHDSSAAQGPTRLEVDGVPRFGVEDLGVAEVFRRLRQWQPDVCFSHNMRQLHLDERMAEEWPLVKMMHGYFGTCVSSQKCHTAPGVSACGRALGPSCLALYLPRRCGQLRPWRMVRQFQWALRQRDVFTRYAAIVVASDHMAVEYRRNGAPHDRLTTAPLFPTDVTAASPRPRPHDPTVLFAGRMTTLKGCDLLVHAIAHASRRLGRSIRLIMAGDGPERVRVRTLASSLHVDAAFPGWVSGAERTAAFRGATVLAVPSAWPEPFGLVGLEAAAHGVPAVAFDVGGISEWLRDGINGRLVRPPGDAQAFGSALAGVLGAPGLLDVLEEGAVAAAARMTMDAHVTIVEGVLRRAADRAVAIA